MNSRERVAALFAGKKPDYIPVFSGYGNITVHGLKKYGWKFAEIHTDPVKMAKMANSTYELFGYECSVAPFDMAVEAEVLGSKANFYTHQDGILYPTIVQHVSEKVTELEIKVPADIAGAKRVPVVTEALGMMKKAVGDEVMIGSWVLGPYTLAGQLVDIADLAKSAFKRTELVNQILEQLTDYLIKLIAIYRQAGAEYITVREMGAGPDILSPRMFKVLIQPHLQRLFASIESPKVLHICGDTNAIVELMNECGADVLSLEKKNDIVETRRKLGNDALIFGDIDPYGVLVQGTVADVDRAVKEAFDAGVNALWPGCDIWPDVPAENMKAMMDSARKYGKL